jgi:hypothetical protein
MDDLAFEMTDSLSRTGQGGMLAPLQFVDGALLNPSISFVLEPTLGFYRAGTEDMRACAGNRDVARFTLANQLEVQRNYGTGLAWYLVVDSESLTGSLDVLQGEIDQNASDISDNTDAIALRILRSGDAMTGQLDGITPVAIANLTRKDYVDGEVSTLLANINTRVLKAGDIMTGQLQGITPISDPDFTRKDYVDTLIAGVGGSVVDRVLRSGDTMTGQLGLPGGGVSSQAATVDQIGEGIAAHVAASDPHVVYQLKSEKGANDGYCPLNSSGLVPAALLPVTNLEFLGTWDASGNTLPPTPAGGGFYVISVAGTLTLVPADGSSSTPTPTAVNPGDYILYSDETTFWYQLVPNFDQEDARYVQLSGSTMTGQIVGITPVSAGDLTRKDYVDAADLVNSQEAQAAQVAADAANSNANTRVLKTGDTMTGQLNGISPVAAENLTRRDYVDTGDTNANNNANTRVLKAGDTMTGQLNGITPSAAANLTRKDYVDNLVNAKVAKSGDTMTGQLNGITPTAAANLTRKDYVDSAVASKGGGGQTFTATGTFTVPAGITEVWVSMCGGGGGGGSGGASWYGGGGGGGGNAVLRQVVAVTPGANIAVTIGGGGGAAAAGGVSSFGTSISMSGGGAATNGGSSGGVEGGPGASQGAFRNMYLYGSGTFNGTGVGGGNLLSPTTQNRTSGNRAGAGYGSGGTGQYANSGNGAAGSSGICIIEW